MTDFGRELARRLGYGALVIYHGWDGIDASWWHWMSTEGADDGSVSIPIRDLDEAMTNLRESLPGVRQSDDVALAPDEVPAQYRGASPRELAMVLRVGRGCFSHPGSERELLAEIGESVLPERFLSRLKELVAQYPPGDDGRPQVCLRIGSSTKAAVVPWALLPTRNPDNPDERLVDIVEVVDMPPFLERDYNADLTVPEWRDVKDLPPLYVIDPANVVTHEVPSPVLGQAAQGVWGHIRDRAQHGITEDWCTAGWVAEGLDRNVLSEQLRGPDAPVDSSVRSTRSKMLYVGHVVTVTAQMPEGIDDERTVELELFEHHRNYGVVSETSPTDPNDPRYPAEGARRKPARRGLSANDLLLGTLGHDEHRDDLTRHLYPPPPTPDGQHTPLRRAELAWKLEFGPDGPTYPACAVDAEGRILPLAGRVIWPIPLRVGLIACASGADLESVEPFGLVTVLLEGGAMHVVATRWTILTDQAAKLIAQVHGENHDGMDRFHHLALEVDAVLSSDDPVRAVNSLLRDRLDLWRTNPTFQNSPALWGSLAVFHAPKRGPVEPDQLARALDIMFPMRAEPMN